MKSIVTPTPEPHLPFGSGEDVDPLLAEALRHCDAEILLDSDGDHLIIARSGAPGQGEIYLQIDPTQPIAKAVAPVDPDAGVAEWQAVAEFVMELQRTLKELEYRAMRDLYMQEIQVEELQHRVAFVEAVVRRVACDRHRDQGRTSRRSAPRRTRGSRRVTTSSGSRGDPDEPEPPLGGATEVHTRASKAVAHGV